MRIKTVAGLALAGMALAGCSSTSGGGTATSPGAAASTTATAPAGGSAPSTASDGSTGPGTGQSTDAASSAPGGSDKPVAALLAKITPPIGAGNRLSTTNMPAAQPAWIAAVARTDSYGKPTASEAGLSVNLAALVDEAAKTEDLDSLVKLCYLDCDRLPQLMPAKDASGRTGFQRLSQLLEKTHPAPGYSQTPTTDFPGFAANNHGAATALDQQDMKLLGASGTYSGLRTGFLADDGKEARVGWDAVLSPNA